MRLRACSVGNDTLVSGLGADALTWDNFADRFDFVARSQAAAVNSITDLQRVEEIIRLDHLAFTGCTVGAQAASAFVERNVTL